MAAAAGAAVSRQRQRRSRERSAPARTRPLATRRSALATAAGPAPDRTGPGVGVSGGTGPGAPPPHREQRCTPSPRPHRCFPPHPCTGAPRVCVCECPTAPLTRAPPHPRFSRASPHPPRSRPSRCPRPRVGRSAPARPPPRPWPRPRRGGQDRAGCGLAPGPPRPAPAPAPAHGGSGSGRHRRQPVSPGRSGAAWPVSWCDHAGGGLWGFLRQGAVPRARQGDSGPGTPGGDPHPWASTAAPWSPHRGAGQYPHPQHWPAAGHRAPTAAEQRLLAGGALRPAGPDRADRHVGPGAGRGLRRLRRGERGRGSARRAAAGAAGRVPALALLDPSAGAEPGEEAPQRPGAAAGTRGRLPARRPAKGAVGTAPAPADGPGDPLGPAGSFRHRWSPPRAAGLSAGIGRGEKVPAAPRGGPEDRRPPRAAAEPGSHVAVPCSVKHRPTTAAPPHVSAAAGEGTGLPSGPGAPGGRRAGQERG